MFYMNKLNRTLLVMALVSLGELTLISPSLANVLSDASGLDIDIEAASTAAWRPEGSNAVELGLAIFSEADRRDRGYVDVIVDMRMVLRTQKGRETNRTLRIQQLEVLEDGDKAIVVFDSPSSIRGTALLSHGHLRGDDDQWLFLPALKRVKKIASRNKSRTFVGSEFSFEDLAPPDLTKFTYEFINEEDCGSHRCYVVDRFPIDKFSGYVRQRVWLEQEHLTIQQIEYTNRQAQLAKRLVLGGYEQFEGRFWRPGFMRMDNLITGRSTDLHWQNYKFGNDLTDDRHFSVNALRRARASG